MRLILIAAPMMADRPFAPAPGLTAAQVARARTLAATLPRGPVLAAPEAGATVAALGLEALTDAALSAPDSGGWDALPLPDILARAPEAMRAWTTDPAARPGDGGASLTELCARMGDWLDTLPDTETAVIAVTYPQVLRAALVAALDAPPALGLRIDLRPLRPLVLTRSGSGWRWRADLDGD